jgi:hypothetical protein
LWRETGNGNGAKAKGAAKATTKYRDLSTVAASAPPSVEMTFVLGGFEENGQRHCNG